MTANLISVPVNSTWANLAWGNGNDSITGRTFVDIDLFDMYDQIPGLHAKGHKVICYFSAGSWENWRPDANKPEWSKVKIGKMDGWNESWLDIRQISALQDLMSSRIDLAAQYGCDGVEPDNTDCYDNKECWSSMTNPTVLKGSTVIPAQIAYVKWMAQYAHSKGMVIGFKNSLTIVPDVVSVCDFAVNEECFTYDECDAYAPFTKFNKAVFSHIYKSAKQSGSNICTNAAANKIVSQYCSSLNGNLCDGTWTHCSANEVDSSNEVDVELI